MKHQYFKFLVLIMLAIGFKSILAQDTIKLNQSIVVAKGSTYTVKAGTTLIMSPNVRILVEGSIDLNGTIEKPIQIISEKINEPGEGFIIKGNNITSSIHLSHVNFYGLIQPIRFDPYWSRKEVNLNYINISKSNFFEPIIYVSAPLIDLNKNVSKINISNGHFFNNNSGIIIESAGNLKYELHLANLAFYENNIKGVDSSLGLLHIELAKPFYSKNLKTSNLAFNRNSEKNGSIGFSVTGNQDTIAVDRVFSSNENRPIYDNQNDSRLPYVNTTISDLSNWPEELNWIKSINHKQDTIDFVANKPLNITQLLDSSGNLVPFSIRNNGQQTQVFYNETISFKTIPVKAIIDNNYSVILPPPVFVKDTTRQKYLVKQEAGLWIQSSAYYFPYVKFIPTFEVLMWGGFATYFGDIKTRWGLPGALDWSGAIGLQYNYSKKISFSANFNNFSVSMGNASAAVFLGRAAPILSQDKNNNYIYNQNTFAELNFITEILSLDANILWNLKPLNNYESVKSDKVTFTPILGLGLTVFKFDPYRNLYYSQSPDSNVKVSLRELGTEGQNFNGKGQYAQYSGGINAIFQINISYKKFHLKGDMKYVFTFTDYLDDYGKGTLYGGDYNRWVGASNGKLDEDIKVFSSTRSLKTYFPEYNLQSKRTSDIITDSYLQIHIGVGYDIGTLRKKK